MIFNFYRQLERKNFYFSAPGVLPSYLFKNTVEDPWLTIRRLLQADNYLHQQTPEKHNGCQYGAFQTWGYQISHSVVDNNSWAYPRVQGGGVLDPPTSASISCIIRLQILAVWQSPACVSSRQVSVVRFWRWLTPKTLTQPFELCF